MCLASGLVIALVTWLSLCSVVYSSLRHAHHVPTGNTRHQARTTKERASIEIQGIPFVEAHKPKLRGGKGSNYFQARHNPVMARSKRYALQGTKWYKKRLTYRVMNTTPDLPRPLVLSTLKEAFGKWAKVTNLVFVQVLPTSRDADITIRFVPAGYHGDEKPFRKGISERLVGHTFPPWNNTGRSGDIHFNDDKYFSLPGRARAAYDLLWIAMHEIGHSLGLAHTGYPLAVMYSTYMAYFYRRVRELSSDDVRAIQALYGPPLPSGIPNACAVTSLDAMVTTADGMTYVFKGAFFWVMSERGPSSSALRIGKFWTGLEDDIDAAFTRGSDGMTFLFKDSRFWMFRNRMKYKGPLPITDAELNIALDLANMDAALESPNQNTVFLFKGSKYWRYRADRREMHPSKPKRIGQGMLDSPDAALRWSSGRRYVFKGDVYYRLKGRGVHKKPGYPKSTADNWMACGYINTLGPNPFINP